MQIYPLAKSRLSQDAIFISDIEPIWNNISAIVAELFGKNAEELDRMRKNKLSKLVAMLPYIAGCDTPDRVAVTHLSTLLIAATPAAKSVFTHRLSDNSSLDTRLERIANFPGGNENILEKGMALLKMIMINDHIKDQISDVLNAKYNPITASAWDQVEELRRLEKISRSCSSDCIDYILPSHEVYNVWWEVPPYI